MFFFFKVFVVELQRFNDALHIFSTKIDVATWSDVKVIKQSVNEYDFLFQCIIPSLETCPEAF